MRQKTVTAFNLLPSQRKFFESTKQFVLYSGGVGCGKTWMLMAILLSYCLWYPGLKALVVTGTYPQLRDTIYAEFVAQLSNRYVERHIKNTSTLIFHNGSTVYFRSFDDPQKLRGFQVGLVIAEECTTLKEADFRGLTDRLRQDGMPLLLRGACNPASPTHWLYKTFIEEPMDGSEVIYGVSHENIHLPKLYLKSLERYKGTEYYKRMVMGEWCALEGLVYDLPQKQRVLREGDYNIGGLDFGHTHPCAFNVISKVGDGYSIIAEFNRVGMNMEQIIEKAKLLTEQHKVKYWVCDSAMPMMIEELTRSGLNAKPSSKGKDSLGAGINLINSLIAGERFFVNPSCTKTLREFDSYVWDSNERRDTPIKANDHHLDAIRYAIMEDNNYVAPDYSLSFI